MPRINPRPALRKYGAKGTLLMVAALRQLDKKMRFTTIAVTLTAAATISSAGCATKHGVFKLGAIYPMNDISARTNYNGLKLAASYINEHGGVNGRTIVLRGYDSATGVSASRLVLELKHWGATAIVGGALDTVGVPVSQAADAMHVVYVEAGAPSPKITGNENTYVFRTATSSGELAHTAVEYTVKDVGALLHRKPGALHITVVHVSSVFGDDVSRNEVQQLRELGVTHISQLAYHLPGAHFAGLARALARQRPDAILLAGAGTDAVGFRKATISEHVPTGAIVLVTESSCQTLCAAALGKSIVGLFAADRPNAGVNSRALATAPTALRKYVRDAYVKRFGTPMGTDGVNGFVAGWILLQDIAPVALTRFHSVSPDALRKAAIAIHRPYGSEINGSGVEFAASGPEAGQNLRAVNVVWQWQKGGQTSIVAPRVFATSGVVDVPLSDGQS
jgi:ABC-type branched-subunit amino acid transport system substrate-binding protein